MTKKKIHFNAFEMNTVNHMAHGLWAHPDDQRIHYKTADYWVKMAQLLEQGLFDAIFLADIGGVYEPYEGSYKAAVKRGMQSPINDPFINVGLMLGATQHLGFAVSASTSYEDPYNLARRFSTIDHLSNGRVAWNVVTSALESAALNHGHNAIIPHEQRYQIAEEFMEVCYKLWEHSWEDGAVQADRSQHVYSDPDKVHTIDHEGTYFKVRGPHSCEPSIQRTPVIFQAGTSSTGKKFAAKHAEGVFIAGSEPEKLRQTVHSIREHAVANGRQPDDVKVFGAVTIIAANTEQELQQKLAEYDQYYLPEASFIQFSGSTGIDLGSLPDDEIYGQRHSEGNQSTAQLYSDKKAFTIGHVKQELSKFAARTILIKGTPEDVADQIEELVDYTGLDGFNIYQAITPATFRDVVELVIPELQKRGRYRTRYEDTSFRDRLFQQGDRLSKNHTAYSHRIEAKAHDRVN